MYLALSNYISRWLVPFLLFLVSGQTVCGQSVQLQTAIQQIWFNTLANKMGLSTNQFQLYPGTVMVGNTSDWMWQIFNAIPGKSTGHYYNPEQYNSFSSDYGLILYCMKAGDVNYMLNNAILMYESAGNKYVWDKTIGNLKTSLAAGSSMQLDTNITITYVSDTSGAKSSVDVNMQAQFNKYTVFYSSPYSKADSLNQDLKLYQPWFSSPMFYQAFNVSDNTVWNKEATVTWQTAFGPAGFMQNICIALVAVDGVNIKISFKTPDTQNADRSSTVENPQYDPSMMYTANSSINSSYIDTGGDFVYTITSLPGNAILLGVLVSTMDSFVNHPH
jgi:hypothetical protein